MTSIDPPIPDPQPPTPFAHRGNGNPSHLGEWRKRGYQDWLLAQTWLAQIRARQEPAAELAADTDATQLNHAALNSAPSPQVTTAA